MTVVAIRGNHMIIVTQQRHRSHCDGLLADVKVQEPAHLPLAVEFESCLLETPDANHFMQERDLLF